MFFYRLASETKRRFFRLADATRDSEVHQRSAVWRHVRWHGPCATRDMGTVISNATVATKTSRAIRIMLQAS